MASESLKKKAEGPKELCNHPETGDPIFLKEGRFGPYIQSGDKMKSLELCVARFDDDTKASFMDLYTKIDAGINVGEEEEIKEESEIEKVEDAF